MKGSQFARKSVCKKVCKERTKFGWKEGRGFVTVEGRMEVSEEGFLCGRKKGRKFIRIEGRKEGSLQGWKEGRKLVRENGN